MPEIVVALDFRSADDARRLLDRLEDLRWAKIGSVLYVREGPSIIRELQQRGIRVFLDLKWHDIPSIVAETVSVARDIGVDMATLHASGGSEMMKAAAQQSGQMRLVGVTVLTSHDGHSLRDAAGVALGGKVEDVVVRLASNASQSGLDGVVCSAQEVGAVRELLPAGSLVVVPGIRMEGDNAVDQRRTADPAVASRAGATHLVVGRPVTESPNPALALRHIAEMV
ncbi:MAG: orotidine-5'-phosphate decarboxylase [Gemmatimonadales bacterium]